MMIKIQLYLYHHSCTGNVEGQIDQHVLSFGLHFSTVVVMMIKIQMGKVEDKLTNLSSGGEGIEWIKYESGRKR